MARVVTIQFGYAGKLYDFKCGDLQLELGEHVIVETEKGRGIGSVARVPVERSDANLHESMKQIIRTATPEDIESAARNKMREQEAYTYCLNKIAERGLEMKLIRVEYLFDGSKAVFFFTADGRVDFRDLVKDLAFAFHTRIEMRQVGVRDEAKMVGGIGICGRELCCASFLRDFEPVSVKMAKEQNLALNPTKISGQCGRLLCCLGYEFETYSTLKKSLPKCGRHVQCGEVCGEVIKQNVLNESVVIRTDDNKEVVLRGDAIQSEQAVDRSKKPAVSKEQQETTRQGNQNRSPRDRRPPQKQNQRRPDHRHEENRGPKEKS